MNPISSFLKTVLEWIYALVGNYGWSVILFTVLIRAILLPLDVKSKRGMRAMSAVQPKMQALQKKYANDKEKLNQKMNELYRKEKINPMAGCLPMLIQLPILFCMFTAMRVVANEETVRMVIEWASHFAEGGYDALVAAVQDGADGINSVLLSWEQIVANGLAENFHPDFQSFLWIKNIYQADSFATPIMPTVSSLMSNGLQAVNGTYLTQEHINIASAFLQSDTYAQLLSHMGMGTDNFTHINIPFLITTFTISFPKDWATFTSTANGLFILPVLAAVSQFVSTLLMPQQQQQQGQQQQAGMNNFMKWFFPIFSLFICATSTAAFSLYWVAVNLIMIVQQQVINWYFDKKDAAAKNVGEEALKP